MQTFNTQETQRYHRQLLLPEFGPEGQSKLQRGSVLVIGAGGLGCPILQYLAAAGVGRIGIVDADTISVSNLHRQILYTDQDIGKAKVEVAKQKLLALNPLIQIETHQTRIHRENAMALISKYDIIIDGSDNFPTRYLVNDACVLSHKPLVYGAIYKFEGQVSVFNALQEDGTRSPNYRDLFPVPPAPDSVPSCAEIGVIGVLPGIIGCLQANEAIKLLAKIGDSLVGRLYVIDTLSFNTHILKYKAQIQTSISELIDYDDFCGRPDSTVLDIISPEQLKAHFDAGEEITLIDVRQAFEYEHGHLDAINLPLDKLEAQIQELPKEKDIVLYCRSGQRSAQAYKLMHEAGFSQIKHLEGGLLAYKATIATELQVL